MLGLIVTIIAGTMIQRLWPHGVIFMLVYPVIALPLQILIAAPGRAEFGESADLSLTALLSAYALTAAVNAVIFLVTFGITALIRVRSKRTGSTPNP